MSNTLRPSAYKANTPPYSPDQPSSSHETLSAHSVEHLPSFTSSSSYTITCHTTPPSPYTPKHQSSFSSTSSSGSPFTVLSHLKTAASNLSLDLISSQEEEILSSSKENGTPHAGSSTSSENKTTSDRSQNVRKSETASRTKKLTRQVHTINLNPSSPRNSASFQGAGKSPLRLLTTASTPAHIPSSEKFNSFSPTKLNSSLEAKLQSQKTLKASPQRPSFLPKTASLSFKECCARLDALLPKGVTVSQEGIIQGVCASNRIGPQALEPTYCGLTHEEAIAHFVQNCSSQTARDSMVSIDKWYFNKQCASDFFRMTITMTLPGGEDLSFKPLSSKASSLGSSPDHSRTEYDRNAEVARALATLMGNNAMALHMASLFCTQQLFPMIMCNSLSNKKGEQVYFKPVSSGTQTLLLKQEKKSPLHLGRGGFFEEIELLAIGGMRLHLSHRHITGGLAKKVDGFSQNENHYLMIDVSWEIFFNEQKNLLEQTENTLIDGLKPHHFLSARGEMSIALKNKDLAQGVVTKNTLCILKPLQYTFSGGIAKPESQE